MSFPRYPKYKDSGVEWLGEVPEHWDVRRLKFLCDVQTGSRDTENAVDEGSFPFFVRSQTIERIDSVAFDCEAVLTAGDGAGVGKVFHHYIGPFDFHQRVYMLNNFRHVLGRFVFHFLRENFYKVALEGGAKSTVDSLRRPLFLNFPFAVPSVDEQTSIVEFVECESAKIDELVAEQQRLIELLKEKRQAVISHAVTKGLNPHAPMKPSGIEWLGDVPEHWEVAPLKHVVSMRSGGTPSKENLAYWDGDVPWASSKDLKTETLSDTQDHITQAAVDERVAELVPTNSLLIVVRGMILIHTFPVVKALVPMAINQDLKALTPSPKLNVDFLAWLLRGTSRETLGRIDEAAHGTKVLRIEAWTSMALPIPPLNEQLHIVSGLVDQLRKLDILTAEAERAVQLLQERRTALISAAVTGQIDVRQLANKKEAA